MIWLGIIRGGIFCIYVIYHPFEVEERFGKNIGVTIIMSACISIRGGICICVI